MYLITIHNILDSVRSVGFSKRRKRWDIFVMAMERLEFTGDNFSGYLWGFIEQRCVLFESRELQNALQNPIETS
jgi:hypothetical protein